MARPFFFSPQILLTLTLLRPERVYLTRRTKRPLVSVLLDRSGSMATVDVVTNKTSAISRKAWVDRCRAADK